HHGDGDQEHDQEHQHHIGQRNHVDVRHRGVFFAFLNDLACHTAEFFPLFEGTPDRSVGPEFVHYSALVGVAVRPVRSGSLPGWVGAPPLLVAAVPLTPGPAPPPSRGFTAPSDIMYPCRSFVNAERSSMIDLLRRTSQL